MKMMKYSIILILAFCLCQFAVGEERRKPIPMEQLTNPSSRFYIPHPYPKNKNEIIANLRFQLKGYYPPKKTTQAGSKANLLEILDGKTSYKLGKIIKVKNRIAHIPHDYSWLILILDKDEKIVLRVVMRANGRAAGSANIKCGPSQGEKYGPQSLKSEQEVLSILSASIGRPISGNEIKQMERVAFQSNIGPQSAPMWEIVLSNGNVYYYSVITDCIYAIEKKIPWKKDKDGKRESPRKLVPHDDFAIDTINDEILVFKRL